jgi:hypothetical protein
MCILFYLYLYLMNEFTSIINFVSSYYIYNKYQYYRLKVYDSNEVYKGYIKARPDGAAFAARLPSAPCCATNTRPDGAAFISRFVLKYYNNYNNNNNILFKNTIELCHF